MTGTTEHVRAAEGLLRTADQARNSDHWRGDRNADSQALATCALAHAALALTAALGAAGARTYSPVINPENGREWTPPPGQEYASSIMLLPAPWVRLEPDAEHDGFFVAPDGSRWFGCTDSVWRQAVNG